MKLLSIFLFASIICLNVDAQISFKTEYIETSRYRKTKGESDERVGDSKGSAMVYQGNVNIPLSTKLNENNRPTAWGVSASGAYVSLNNKNFTDDLVLNEIMNLGLNLYHLRPLSNRWSMMASIGGGIFTPNARFSKIKFKNVLGSGGIIFIRHLKPNLDLGGGIALNNSFGFPMIFPAMYLNWNTQGPVAIKISLMQGLEIAATYNFSESLNLSFITEMDGQMALLEKEGKDKMFTHQYIVVGLRPQIKIGKHISIPITAGINAMRTAEFNDRKLKSLFKDEGYYFQVSPYLSAGVTVGF